MNRSKAALVVVIGAALAACQQTPDKSATEASAKVPEQRISAPEQPMTTAAPADPASFTLAPESADPAPVYVERAPAAPARRPAASNRRATRPAPPAPATPEPREAVEPVERRVAAEPMEPIEPMAGTVDPGPRRDTLVIPGGTELRVVLETGLSSETSQAGERVVARVERATSPEGQVVLPGGTVLRGKLVHAATAGRVRGRSNLTVDFDRIVVRGQEHPLQAASITVDGPDDTKRDVAIIAGSTAAGAVIGEIMNKGAKKGAVVGAATGAGAVLVTRGGPVEMPAGSRWTLRVSNTVRLD